MGRPQSKEPVDSNEALETASPASGWRAQPLALKALLFASLIFVAAGVFRCSAELVPISSGRSILVERATVAMPDSLLAIPSDSLALLTTRLFARNLRGAHDGDVVVGELRDAWAVARLHLRATSDGGIELIGTAASVVSGRRMSAVTASGSPDRLREMAAEAAAKMSRQLAAKDSGTEGR